MGRGGGRGRRRGHQRGPQGSEAPSWRRGSEVEVRGYEENREGGKEVSEGESSSLPGGSFLLIGCECLVQILPA